MDGAGCRPDLPCEVETLAFVLEVLDDPKRLLGVAERPGEERRERLLAEMSERRVPQVVSEGDGLCEVLVETECPRGGPRDLRRRGCA